MTVGVIYKILIEGSDKCYIGSAVDFKKRKGVHLRTLKNKTHRNQHLQRAYYKYGSIDFEILEECENEVLIEREQEWIDKYPFSSLFNICSVAGNRLGVKHTEQSRQKISENHYDCSGANNPQYGLTGSLSPNWGRKHSEETKRKISEARKKHYENNPHHNLGKKRPEHSKKMTGENNHFYGKQHSEDTKSKIADAARKRARERGGKKITLEVAREIRMRYNEGQVTQRQLAEEYGLNRSYVSQLIRGVYWNEETTED
jgi:group I intron endonuclease